MLTAAQRPWSVGGGGEMASGLCVLGAVPQAETEPPSAAPDRRWLPPRSLSEGFAGDCYEDGSGPVWLPVIPSGEH